MYSPDAGDAACGQRRNRDRSDGAELGGGSNGSAEHQSLRHDVLGRRRIVDRGRAVAQQAQRRADAVRAAQAHDVDRGRRHHDAEEEHYRRIQANLVTRRQGRAEFLYLPRYLPKCRHRAAALT